VPVANVNHLNPQGTGSGFWIVKKKNFPGKEKKEALKREKGQFLFKKKSPPLPDYAETAKEENVFPEKKMSVVPPSIKDRNPPGERKQWTAGEEKKVPRQKKKKKTSARKRETGFSAKKGGGTTAPPWGNRKMALLGRKKKKRNLKTLPPKRPGEPGGGEETTKRGRGGPKFQKKEKKFNKRQTSRDKVEKAIQGGRKKGFRKKKKG